jgi:hypothetical protein
LTIISVAILGALDTEANALDIYTKVCMSGEVEEALHTVLGTKKA